MCQYAFDLISRLSYFIYYPQNAAGFRCLCDLVTLSGEGAFKGNRNEAEGCLSAKKQGDNSEFYNLE
jgi:hypothetical protein